MVMMIWFNHSTGPGRSPKNAYIVIGKLTKITSHGSTGVKLDVIVIAGLKVQGFCFSPSGLHLTIVGLCPMEL